MALKNFIDNINSHDLSEEEMSIIDNLAKLSSPETMSRDEYNKCFGETFGGDVVDYHDKKDIETMLTVAKSEMPEDIAENLPEIEDEIKADALDISKEYHTVALATALSVAIDNATDVKVAPVNLLEPYALSSSAYGLADKISDEFLEDEDGNHTNSSMTDEDDDDYDDFGFDDDDDSDYE